MDTGEFSDLTMQVEIDELVKIDTILQEVATLQAERDLSEVGG